MKRAWQPFRWKVPRVPESPQKPTHEKWCEKHCVHRYVPLPVVTADISATGVPDWISCSPALGYCSYVRTAALRGEQKNIAFCECSESSEMHLGRKEVICQVPWDAVFSGVLGILDTMWTFSVVSPVILNCGQLYSCLRVISKCKQIQYGGP